MRKQTRGDLFVEKFLNFATFIKETFPDKTDIDGLMVLGPTKAAEILHRDLLPLRDIIDTEDLGELQKRAIKTDEDLFLLPYLITCWE